MLPRLLLALSLLATPALAQPTPAGWIADAKGCRVWNNNPQPDESIAWSGACGADGLAQGPGVLQWFEKGKPTDRYEGEYRGGETHGRGAYIAADGTRYDGAWRYGKRDGQGSYADSNGDRYDGEWREGSRHGRGRYVFAADGFVYDGEWRDGEMNGRGVGTFPNGARYDGEWKDGYADGQGTLTADGETYTGRWTKGCFRPSGDRSGEQRAYFAVDPKTCGLR